MSWLLMLRRARAQRRLARATRLVWQDRRGGVAIIFALCALPIVTVVALAVDFSFYVQARSQLNLAADAAAMHAVRAASQAYSLGYTTAAAEQAVGVAAGQQWFDAQLGTLSSASINDSNVNVTVTYVASPGTFTSNVTYNATVATHIGQFITPFWPLTNATASAGSGGSGSGGSGGTAGTGSSGQTYNGNTPASAVVSNSYVEILLLLDNSSSMLLGSSLKDIVAIEQATMCSTSTGHGMSEYSWYYTAGYGYPASQSQRVPPATPVNGSCDANYDGDPSACFYVPSVAQSTSSINPVTGYCANGNVPQAPCGFACHSSANNNDNYGAARAIHPAVTLRLDVVQQAAANVITTLQTQQQFLNQFSVGVYEFNSGLTKVYPAPGGGEASTNLAGALSAVTSVTTPVTSDVANTYFTSSANQLSGSLTANGDGRSPTTPTKDLFIVTDGLADFYDANGNRVMGPITNPSNEQTCQAFKNLGINVYVLYTPYLPIPNPFYLSNTKSYVEPQATSPVTLALQACASSPANYALASNAEAVNSTLQKMLLSALNSAARISQ